MNRTINYGEVRRLTEAERAEMVALEQREHAERLDYAYDMHTTVGLLANDPDAVSKLCPPRKLLSPHVFYPGVKGGTFTPEVVGCTRELPKAIRNRPQALAGDWS